MYRIPRFSSHFLLLAVAAAALLLGACSSGVRSEAANRKLEHKFGLTVESYKNDQFLLDGAVLTPVDLSSHFAYLRDQHRMPGTVLLMRSEDAAVRKSHLQAMARLSIDYGFALYYDKDGKLRRIEVTDKKDLPKLRDSTKKSDMPDRMKGTTARGVNQFPSTGN